MPHSTSHPPWLTWSEAIDLCGAHNVRRHTWIKLAQGTRRLEPVPPATEGEEVFVIARKRLRGRTQCLYQRDSLLRALQIDAV